MFGFFALLSQHFLSFLVMSFSFSLLGQLLLAVVFSFFALLSQLLLAVVFGFFALLSQLLFAVVFGFFALLSQLLLAVVFSFFALLSQLLLAVMFGFFSLLSQHLFGMSSSLMTLTLLELDVDYLLHLLGDGLLYLSQHLLAMADSFDNFSHDLDDPMLTQVLRLLGSMFLLA